MSDTANGRYAASPLALRTIAPHILILLTLTLFPYLVGWWAAPDDFQFIGAFVNPDDLSTYLSAMRQGGEGNWLFHFPFSPEPWQPKLMLLPYLLWGKLTFFLTTRPLIQYQLLRLLCALFLLLACWRWVRVLLPDNGRYQHTAWLFLGYGSGLGWLALILLGQPTAAPISPDLFMPEWTLFMALLHTPHFALGLGLLLLLMAGLAKQLQTGAWGWVWGNSLLAVLLGLTYVYHIPVVGFVFGLQLLWLAVSQKEIPWRIWLQGGMVLLPLTLLLLYYTIIANQDPYFAQYAVEDHLIPAPPPLGLLIGFGLLLPLALAGGRRWLANGRLLLLPLWAAGTSLLLYFPFIQFTGRFALGLMVPITTLAAYQLESWLAEARLEQSRWQFLTPTPKATLRRLTLILLLPNTLILPLWFAWGAVQSADFPLYIHVAEAKAIAWLAAQADPSTLVLADYPASNYMPRNYQGRLFLGQLDYTTELDEKLMTLEAYFASDTSTEERLAFLAEWEIDFVFVGRFERVLMQEPLTLPGTAVYENETVTIYQIE